MRTGRAGSLSAHFVHRGAVEHFGQVRILRQQIDRDGQSGGGARSVGVVLKRVVVERHPLDTPTGCQAEKPLFSDLQPSVVDPVIVATGEMVVQQQSEAGRAQAVGPYLGVLAVRSFRSLGPLPNEQGIDAVMRPRERLVVKPGDVEGFVPATILGQVCVEAEHQVEPPFEEKVALSGDGIGGKTQGSTPLAVHPGMSYWPTRCFGSQRSTYSG